MADFDRYQHDLRQRRHDSNMSPEERAYGRQHPDQARFSGRDDYWRQGSEFGGSSASANRGYEGRSWSDTRSGRDEQYQGSGYGSSDGASERGTPGQGYGGYGGQAQSYGQYGSDRYERGAEGYGWSPRGGSGYGQRRYGQERYGYPAGPDQYARGSSWRGDYGGQAMRPHYEDARRGDSAYAGGYQGYNEGRPYWERGDDRNWFQKAGDEVKSWFSDDEDRGHRGRGPKNYTRSDDRIRDDVSDRLSDDWTLDASDIELEVKGGEVTLSGHVDSRWDKRRAEDLVEGCSGVRHVQNNLRIKERDDSYSSRLSSEYSGTAATSNTTRASASSRNTN
ncbi:BON domain-containing protein [Brevundimonas sp. 2R-24]|uniref:BON domain-containing protein n=1 Tax=Peiella sedimenti TaxID=3061083 RepID=A0ABT8SKY4_9CAUL|nr:BON domain-containing protein [Caulobacteraceae bacterium XZ-24]